MREEEGWGEMRGSIDREKEKNREREREREREENCVLFVCLFVQYRSHTTVCLVLDCDLIVAEG